MLDLIAAAAPPSSAKVNYYADWAIAFSLFPISGRKEEETGARFSPPSSCGNLCMDEAILKPGCFRTKVWSQFLKTNRM